MPLATDKFPGGLHGIAPPLDFSFGGSEGMAGAGGNGNVVGTRTFTATGLEPGAHSSRQDTLEVAMESSSPAVVGREDAATLEPALQRRPFEDGEGSRREEPRPTVGPTVAERRAAAPARGGSELGGGGSRSELWLVASAVFATRAAAAAAAR